MIFHLLAFCISLTLTDPIFFCMALSHKRIKGALDINCDNSTSYLGDAERGVLKGFQSCLLMRNSSSLGWLSVDCRFSERDGVTNGDVFTDKSALNKSKLSQQQRRRSGSGRKWAYKIDLPPILSRSSIHLNLQWSGKLFYYDFWNKFVSIARVDGWRYI